MVVLEAFEPHHVDVTLRHLTPARRWHLPNLQPELDVALNRPPGQQAEILENVAALPLRPVNDSTIEFQRAGGWPEKALNNPQERCLSGTTRADDDTKFGLPDLKVEVVKNMHRICRTVRRSSCERDGEV